MPDAPKPKTLKDTLNLPQTQFAMKANLPQNEPARLAEWDAADRRPIYVYFKHESTAKGPDFAQRLIELLRTR